MVRGIQKVRKSIKRRKRSREINESFNVSKTLPLIASDEEKHGMDSPLFHVKRTHLIGDNPKPNRQFLSKIVVSFAFFLCCTFILNTKMDSLYKIQQWLSSVLQEEFPFAKVNEWYISAFGSPLSFPPQNKLHLDTDNMTNTLPVIGHVVETFSSNGTGIMISPEEKTVVSAIRRGVVIFAGNDRKTLKTVVIQHADNSKSTYGLLSSIDVHLYQIVNANDTIGSFQPTPQNEMVYFSIEKDKQFIDPSQVIPVDDIP